MDRHMKSSRRKACDFCYQKKIKCDAVKPQCSPCKLYNADCTYVARTRPHVPKQTSASNRIDLLEQRLRSVESQLLDLGETPQVPASSPPGVAQTPVGAGAGSSGHAQPADAPPPTWGLIDRLGPQDALPAGLDVGVTPLPPSAEAYSPDKLPSLKDIRPQIESYFTTGNVVFPLFHPPSIFRLLNNFYSVPASRTMSSWALINALIALSMKPFGDYTPAQPYIKNAQGVLDELIATGQDDKAALQVTLALTGIFYGVPDVMSSISVFTAIAVRLVQRLRLYTKHQPPEVHFTPMEALERNRLFWMTYILDRDISAKTRHPPLLRDDDIDVDLPSLDPEDGGGVIVSADGRARFNLFRSRIQIAWVQGKAYEWLCSAKAARAPLAQREEIVHRLEKVLLDWRLGVPRHFLPQHVAAETGPEILRFFVQLHWEHFFCRAMVRGAHIHNRPWLLRLAGNARELITNFFDEVCDTECVPDEHERSPPEGWQHLVDSSRECLQMVQKADQDDTHLRWSITLCYFSGALILLAHLLENPVNNMVDEDRKLVDASSKVVETISGQTRLKKIMYFSKAYAEIANRVKAGMENASISPGNKPSFSDMAGQSVWPDISDYEFTYPEMDFVSSMELTWTSFPGSGTSFFNLG